MRIRATIPYAKSLKDELAEIAPEPRPSSSHLTEAVAAGLGFASNAALRAQLANGPVEREIDGAAAETRLTSISPASRVPAGAFRQAALRLMMKRAMDDLPILTPFGIGVYDSWRLTVKVHAAAVAEQQAGLLEPAVLRQFERALQWLRRLDKTKNRTPSIGSSYGLKAVVENYWRDVLNDLRIDTYVSNGAFIAAAHAAGFAVSIAGRSPNPTFNISKRSLQVVRTARAAKGWAVTWSDGTGGADVARREVVPDEARAVRLALDLLDAGKRSIEVSTPAGLAFHRHDDIVGIDGWRRSNDVFIA